jgi:hypothetical protein
LQLTSTFRMRLRRTVVLCLQPNEGVRQTN